MSIAREYGPKGVHTAHVIDTDFTKKWTKDMSTEATIVLLFSDIAESYWSLHTQSKRCFTKVTRLTFGRCWRSGRKGARRLSENFPISSSFTVAAQPLP